ncbi:U2 snRNP-associated SURP domain-containing protein [Perkinsus olseni]|uniref:U2 snRNP-associated SURP domain-containing protein n=1 Tax=Perkinsus olseni TaxID=32597 RepID=A0A7J6T260_PEROL|nr:U2 snRNP-associated SURP domain-containing protein [Perkinsus olseni]
MAMSSSSYDTTTSSASPQVVGYPSSYKSILSSSSSSGSSVVDDDSYFDKGSRGIGDGNLEYHHPAGFNVLPDNTTTTADDDDDVHTHHGITTSSSSRRNLSNNTKTFINSLLCFMGSGVLGLPHAFNEIGLVGGIIILSLVALLALHCMLLLVHCQTYLRDTRSKHAVTYGDVGYYAFGRIGSMLVDICIILTQTGFAVAYLIFISHNVSDILDDYYLEDKKDSIVSRGLILAVILPPLVILSWLRYLKMLAPFSLLAEIAILFALFAVFAYDIQSTSNNIIVGDVSFMFSNISLWLNLSRLPYFFGISVYCYEGVGMVMPVKNSMQNPSSFNRIWSSSVILVTTIYCAFGALGLLAFSDQPTIDSIITRALPHDTILAPFIRVSLCIGLYFTYPLMLFPVYELIDTFFDSTLSYVTLTAILAASIPNFGAFISLVGASASAALAFVIISPTTTATAATAPDATDYSPLLAPSSAAALSDSPGCFSSQATGKGAIQMAGEQHSHLLLLFIFLSCFSLLFSWT